MMLYGRENRRLRTICALVFCTAVALAASASAKLQAQVSETKHASAPSSPTREAVRPLLRRANHLSRLWEEPRAALSVEQRTRLLSHQMILAFDVQSGGPTPAAYRLRMEEYPGWIIYNPARSAFEIDAHAVRMFLEDHADEILHPVRNALAHDDNGGSAVPHRLEVTGNPQSGYRLDAAAAARLLMHALEEGATEVRLPATYEHPALFVHTASGTMQLERLSRGISNFGGSPYGRSANVVKALESQLHGIAIQPGELFSFTDAMADGAGWSDAYVIANGGELVMEPGGGICQAATTAFRAAVLAGLPVEERANHSLYVSYYRAYGVGIDATYYPGKQDFTFRNDTASPIVIVAYADGEDAVVELYGIPDGRTVELSGPYFAEKQDEAAQARGLDLKTNQIGWLYDVTYPDGTVLQDAVVSTYKAIPKKLPDEYSVHPGIEELMGKTGTGGTAGRQ